VSRNRQDACQRQRQKSGCQQARCLRHDDVLCNVNASNRVTVISSQERHVAPHNRNRTPINTAHEWAGNGPDPGFSDRDLAKITSARRAPACRR
jgi:hypothetical protein